MYIVIAGGGLVGGELAARLLENKHDVVVIDPHKEACDHLYSSTGAVSVCGSAATIDTLREAGAEKADVVVAATANDADNLACAILARSMGVPEVIVRMRNADYEKAYRVAGVNRIVRITDLMVNQMMMEIEKPKVRKVTAIGGGKADIFMANIPENAAVAGKTVQEVVGSAAFPKQCVFVAIYDPENDQLTIPRGHDVLAQNTEIYLISSVEDIKRAVDVLTEVK